MRKPKAKVSPGNINFHSHTLSFLFIPNFLSSIDWFLIFSYGQRCTWVLRKFLSGFLASNPYNISASYLLDLDRLTTICIHLNQTKSCCIGLQGMIRMVSGLLKSLHNPFQNILYLPNATPRQNVLCHQQRRHLPLQRQHQKKMYSSLIQTLHVLSSNSDLMHPMHLLQILQDSFTPSGFLEMAIAFSIRLNLPCASWHQFPSWDVK